MQEYGYQPWFSVFKHSMDHEEDVRTQSRIVEHKQNMVGIAILAFFTLNHLKILENNVNNVKTLKTAELLQRRPLCFYGASRRIDE